MFRCCLVSTVVIVFTASDIRADELLYRYEANVHPYDPAAGWITADSCVPPCSDNVDDGRFNLVWATSGDPVNYHYTIAGFGDPVPPNLWVEWRFRSNNPLPPTDDACDGRFRVKFRTILEVVYMFSDAAVSFSGDIVTRWTDVQEFQTFRFESLDGVGYRITVNGRPFITDVGFGASGIEHLQFGGFGGCTTLIPQKINEWDFIRYGTISHGERIIGADPPVGFLDPRVYKGLDRFTVTFDSPNYVYVDEISVETTSGPTPAVVATRRRENDGPETVEILLDRPISIGATTRFMFNDGVATNLVEYTLSDPVPTLSQTGLAVLGVGLLIAAVIVLGRSHRPVQVQ